MNFMRAGATLVSCASLFSAAYAVPAGLSPEDTAKAESLITQIREIANANTTDRTNLTSVRAQIEPLVKELSAFYTVSNVKEELPLLAGGWKQLWADDTDGEGGPVKADYTQTYQVITDKGYFYNISDLKAPLVKPVGFLRGQYTIDGKFLQIEFTKLTARLSPLKAGEDLVKLAEDVESGAERTIASPIDPKWPNGPIGAQGDITNLYLDENFRVATGSNKSAANGKYNLYVLDRANNVIK